MDKFDQTFQGLLKMSPSEFSSQIVSLKGMCPCPGCPTYTDCSRKAKEILFCAIGGSFNCITQDLGCICPTCPVARNLGLTHDRFCLRGGEMTQRYKENLR